MTRALAFVFVALSRAVVALLGVMLMIGFVGAGLVLGSAWVAWSLLRRRQTQTVRFRWGHTARSADAPIKKPFRGRPGGMVVDVEAREVNPFHQR